MKIKLMLQVLAFTFRVMLSLGAFTLKLKIKLHMAKRSWKRRLKRVLEEYGIPQDLREELVKAYEVKLNEVIGMLTSALSLKRILQHSVDITSNSSGDISFKRPSIASKSIARLKYLGSGLDPYHSSNLLLSSLIDHLALPSPLKVSISITLINCL